MFSPSTKPLDSPDLETEKLAKRLQQLQSQPRPTFEDYSLVREVVSSKHEPITETSPATVITDNPTIAGPIIASAHTTVAPPLNLAWPARHRSKRAMVR